MKKIDFLLFLSVLFLGIFGLLMIYDASSFIAFRDFSDKYHYVKEQSFWMTIGFLSMLSFSNFNYHRFYNLALPLLITSIILLILVFIPPFGLKLLGAKRWIDFGLFSLQPSEIVKLTLAIYLSAWFSSKEKGRFWAFILLLSVVLGLIFLQPDMGTAAVVFIEATSIFFLSGANILYFLVLIPIAAASALIFSIVEPYRMARIATFFNFNQDVANTSYHVRQILIALGSGGLFGVGLGNSLQKYAYLPENATDSIFAIIAEEIGFIGSIFIIFVFILIIWRGFKISQNAKDLFGKLLAGGIITFIAAQVLINLSAQTALLPLTGVPLPFISYGGTALVVNLSSIGILLNIKKQSLA